MTAPNIYAHIPPVPSIGQYRMGLTLSPNAADVWINTTMDDGTRIVCAEPEGWEGLTFITPIDRAGGRDGGLVGPPSVAPRVLEIRGAMVSPDPGTLRARIRQLRAMLGKRKQVVWDQFEFGVGVRMGLVCYAEGDFRATPIMGDQNGGVATQISFNLVAANPPWKFGVGTAESECIGLPMTTVSGRTYNKTYSWNYGPFVNPGGVMNLFNRGDRDAFGVFSITGPVDFPVITNETTDEAFIVTSVIPDGQTVEIDTRTGVITPSNYRIAGRPFPLAPGNNTIRWRATSGTFDANAQLCVTWRPTWE